ncbi:MAG: DNA mismatch repair endonuclease MutL [Victivallaceae bacterium]
MSKIRVLPESISNRIAAGEVIERPASVVKELVENAIDAGAGKICVEIEKAGIRLIRVTDDGSGMDADDALLCLEPHATSKISQERDIERIITLGFRGEALPSIASVSRFSLKTRQRKALEGNEVIVQGGKFIKASPVGCAPGTEMTVKDLFFNTPARKKFLKTEATEEKHIEEMLYMLALPYPQITFELFIDGKCIFSSPAHDVILPRLKTFFGKTLIDGMLPVSYSSEELKLSGFIAMHGVSRNTRREQRAFVNGRGIESNVIYQGIRDGYGGMIEKGRFPPTVLFISIDPGLVDVNVHPAKREVRFRNERTLAFDIAEAIRTALRQTPAPSITVDPSVSLKSMLDGADISYEIKQEEHPSFNFPGNFPPGEPQPKTFPSMRPVRINPVGGFRREEHDSQMTEHSETPGLFGAQAAPAPSATTEQTSAAPELPGSGPLKIVGILDDTYILASDASGLIIIDQHAAHERVMFEKLLNCASPDGQTQKLLLPINLELSRAEASFINKNAEILRTLGFEIDPLSSNTVMVSGIPSVIRQENIGGMIHDIISELTENGASSPKADLEAVARAACVAAVKSHDRLTSGEALSLLHQMAQCELPFSCPHGRPTIINISIRELEKRFGRK